MEERKAEERKAEERTVFLYAGTWPALLRGPIPGFKGPQVACEEVRTGIFGFRMCPETGELTPAGNYYTDSITSEMCISADGKYLYACDERIDRKGIPYSGGGILAFRIDWDNGTLAYLNDQASMGTSPPSVDIDVLGRYAFLANLGNPHEKTGEEGSIAMFRILEDGSLAPAADVTGFRGAYPGQGSDFSPHYHCLKVDPSGKYLLACDTNDKIHIFIIDFEKGKLSPAGRPFFETKRGVTPRTILFHPNKPWFFVNNQNNSTVYSFAFDSENGEIEELGYVSAVFNPEDSTRSWTANMAVSQDGGYLYVTNRSLQKLMPDAPCPPDTIAVFKIDRGNGRLSLTAVIPTEAGHPRGLEFSPDGRFLYVAGMDSNKIIRYKVSQDGGMLGNPCVAADLPVPSSIKILVV